MGKRLTKELLNKVEEFEKYLIDRGMGHQNLKYYTNISTVIPMVRKGVLFLGNGTAWNDKLDMDIFNSDNYDYVQFGKCLCFSRSESVAMWRIYAGGKNGCMIDFGTQLSKLVKSITKLDLAYVEKKRIISRKTLTKDQFEIKLRDVAYCDDNQDGTFTMKVAENRLDKIPTDKICNVLSYCKRMCWSYENECRLIVKVPRLLIQEPGTEIKYNTVIIQLPEEIRQFITSRVVRSPLYPEEKWDIATMGSSLEGNVYFID